MVVSVTISSPTNIALIKYWGKKDSKLNTPINSSVSVTLNQKDLRTVTTVSASTEFGTAPLRTQAHKLVMLPTRRHCCASSDKDRLWLNGNEEDVAGNKRLQNVFREVRSDT